MVLTSGNRGVIEQSNGIGRLCIENRWADQNMHTDSRGRVTHTTNPSLILFDSTGMIAFPWESWTGPMLTAQSRQAMLMNKELLAFGNCKLISFSCSHCNQITYRRVDLCRACVQEAKESISWIWWSQIWRNSSITAFQIHNWHVLDEAKSKFQVCS